MTTLIKARDLIVNNSAVAHIALCEFSAEDSTPTLHIDLWRGLDLSDLPDVVADLEIVAEGHWDGGISYSLQLA
jgi:hypothetical protein